MIVGRCPFLNRPSCMRVRDRKMPPASPARVGSSPVRRHTYSDHFSDRSGFCTMGNCRECASAFAEYRVPIVPWENAFGSTVIQGQPASASDRILTSSPACIGDADHGSHRDGGSMALSEKTCSLSAVTLPRFRAECSNFYIEQTVVVRYTLDRLRGGRMRFLDVLEPLHVGLCS